MTHLGTTKPVHPDILKAWQERAHEAEARISELEADNAALLHAVRLSWGWVCSHKPKDKRIRSDHARDVKEIDGIMSTPHHGERILAEITQLKRGLNAVMGWREYDWPEGFCRRTAELIADRARDEARAAETTAVSQLHAMGRT